VKKDNGGDPFDGVLNRNMNRKNFLILLSVGLGGLIASALGGSGLLYILAPAWRKKTEEWQGVAQVSKLPEGLPVKLDYVKRKADGWTVIEGRNSVWLLKEKGGVTAYSPKCTHLGCPIRWDNDKDQFLCPCHTGVFTKKGAVVSGPPPRPLDRYTVKIEDGMVFILPGGAAKS
jgi:menaquinol-cytochrome c reductase iron-sulfur subunit